MELRGMKGMSLSDIRTKAEKLVNTTLELRYIQNRWLALTTTAPNSKVVSRIHKGYLREEHLELLQENTGIASNQQKLETLEVDGYVLDMGCINIGGITLSR